MDLVLNGMEELNEQELMMVDGGGALTKAAGIATAIAGALVAVYLPATAPAVFVTVGKVLAVAGIATAIAG